MSGLPGFTDREREVIVDELDILDTELSAQLGRRVAIVLTVYDNVTGGVVVLSNVDGETAQTIVGSTLGRIEHRVKYGPSGSH